MRLQAIAARRAGALRTFRGAIDAEQDAWRDHKLREVQARHVLPLISENERFDRDLEAAATAIAEAARHLESSRYY